MNTNPPVPVYVMYTQASGTTQANIQYFTDKTGNTQWDPDSLPPNSQTTYYFGVHEDSGTFSWSALTFWPKDSNGNALSNVVESFRFPSAGGKAQFQSTVYVQSINLQPSPPPHGMPWGPSFCVCNNNNTNQEEYVGVQVTICAKPHNKPEHYLTSMDPKIPLKPSN